MQAKIYQQNVLVTDEKGRMIGVISAPAPEKAAAKTFHQKLRGEKEPTREKPLEIRVRDLGEGNDYNFQLWVEISENKGNEAVNGENGKKVVKKLIIRKVV